VLTKHYLAPIVLTLFGSYLSSAAFAQSNTQRGALAGGTAGAIIGGIIGNQNDETPEGVLIGGAVGALAGGLLGNEHDQQIRRQINYQQQQATAYRNGVSMNDAISLSRNGLSSDVIINQIQINGVQQRIGVNEIIALHQQGVDNRVIDAMQRAPLAGSIPIRTQPTVVLAPTVVPHVMRVPYPYHHRHYRRPHPYRSGGTSLHFHYRR